MSITLTIAKVAYLSGQMLCMTAQPHTVPVQAFLTDIDATVISSETTLLPRNQVFSGQVVYEVPYTRNGDKFLMSWGCYPKEVFPQ